MSISDLGSICVRELISNYWSYCQIVIWFGLVLVVNLDLINAVNGKLKLQIPVRCYLNISREPMVVLITVVLVLLVNYVVIKMIDINIFQLINVELNPRCVFALLQHCGVGLVEIIVIFLIIERIVILI